MATLNASQIDVTMSAEELALILRALETHLSHCPISEDDATRALMADLSGGADGN